MNKEHFAFRPLHMYAIYNFHNKNVGWFCLNILYIVNEFTNHCALDIFLSNCSDYGYVTYLFK